MAAHTVHEMWLWGHTITSAIRSEDTSRPVVSGMHSPQRTTLEAESEASDVLSTHPYPTFTPHCRVDPLDSFRSAFHAAAETNYYRDLTGKEAFVEEFGTLGPTISGMKLSRDYLRNLFWNCYSHGCHGALWWCANDQTELPQTPYQWCAMERELGLLKPDGTPKPLLEEFAAFAAFAPKHPLPPRQIDAVVLLPEEVDEWGVGFASFMLAKQAGFDVRFQSCDKKLQPARFYIIPSATGFGIIEKYRLQLLLDAIHDGGATLLMTADGAIVQPVEPFGVEVETSFLARKPLQLHCGGEGADEAFDLPIARTIESRLQNISAEVLGRDQDGRPAFTCVPYGKGQILYLNAPLEASIMDRPDSFGDDAPAFCRIYAMAARRAGILRVVRRDDPQVTLTEHPMDGGARLAVVAVNNCTTRRATRLEIAAGWRVAACHNGEWDADGGTLAIAPKSGALLYLDRA